MPTINEILSSEQSKDRLCIQLYSEGIFFKAYEHSAWLACHILNRFMVKKKYIKKAGQEIVSIGFPKTALGKWVSRTLNGYTGEEVIGPNGNSIFIPYSMGKGFEAFEKVNRGYYWTGSACVDFYDRPYYSEGGYIFYTHLENYIYDWYYGEGYSTEGNEYGFAIRPVKDKQ